MGKGKEDVTHQKQYIDQHQISSDNLNSVTDEQLPRVRVTLISSTVQVSGHSAFLSRSQGKQRQVTRTKRLMASSALLLLCNRIYAS